MAACDVAAARNDGERVQGCVCPIANAIVLETERPVHCDVDSTNSLPYNGSYLQEKGTLGSTPLKRVLRHPAYIAVALIVVGIGIFASYLEGKDLVSRAYLAESHLRAAASDLRSIADGTDAGAIRRARAEFGAARQEFAHISGRIRLLGPLYGIVEAMPWIGQQAKGARKLMQAGAYVSEAAEEASAAAVDLTEAGKTDSGKKGTELVFAAVPTATARLFRAVSAIKMAQDEYGDLSTEGLHPLLSKALAEFESQVPRQRIVLQGALNALGVMSDILGKDRERVYLILVQDAGELRPTGGFVGNYGIVRFRDGKMTEASFNDTYRLDWPYYYSGKAPPVVGMFARYFPEATFWALRDSNIWPDFDRTAMQAARFAIAEGASERVDGVIAFTDDIVNPLLEAVGPIEIPEYGVTVDVSNALDLIRYYQTMGPSTVARRTLGEIADTNRKLFTSLLMKAVLERVNGLDLQGLVGLSLSLHESFKRKAIQAYFQRPEEQRLVEDYDFGGHMKAAAGDYLWVVDMNLGAAKDNLYVRPSIAYSVTVSATGRATSQLELTYDYTRQGNLFTWSIKRGFYANYWRVYVPPGSKLLSEEGTDEPVETYHEQGKTVFGNFLKVLPGTVRKVKIVYSQQLKLWFDGGKARYELLAQRQAGNEPQSFEVTVSLPEGISMYDPGSFEWNGTTLKYRGALPSDLSLGAGLAFTAVFERSRDQY